MKKITHSSVFKMRELLTYGIIALASSVVIPLFYGMFWIRMILTIILLAFLWKNKDQMLAIIWRK